MNKTITGVAFALTMVLGGTAPAAFAGDDYRHGGFGFSTISHDRHDRYDRFDRRDERFHKRQHRKRERFFDRQARAYDRFHFRQDRYRQARTWCPIRRGYY